jgi:hypothetical protein
MSCSVCQTVNPDGDDLCPNGDTALAAIRP